MCPIHLVPNCSCKATTTVNTTVTEINTAAGSFCACSCFDCHRAAITGQHCNDKTCHFTAPHPAANKARCGCIACCTPKRRCDYCRKRAQCECLECACYRALPNLDEEGVICTCQVCVHIQQSCDCECAMCLASYTTGRHCDHACRCGCPSCKVFGTHCRVCPRHAAVVPAPTKGMGCGCQCVVCAKGTSAHCGQLTCKYNACECGCKECMLFDGQHCGSRACVDDEEALGIVAHILTNLGEMTEAQVAREKRRGEGGVSETARWLEVVLQS